MGRKVQIQTDTTDIPITTAGQYAGTCWGSDTSDHEKNLKRGLDCIASGHNRVLEFVQVYFVVDGYSARMVRELYTHIGGAPTRLQASTRYIGYGDFDYVEPPSVTKNEAASVVYKNTMKTIAKAKEELEALGIKKEDSAMVLPLGMTTKVVYRTNLRALIDMAQQRMCTRAYWEFREFFNDLLDSLAFYSDEWEMLIKELKLFQPKCETFGYCNEKFSCGRKPKKENV